MAMKMVVLTVAGLALNCAFLYRQPWMAVVAGCGYALALGLVG